MPYIRKTLCTTEACDAVHDKRLSICLAADGFSFSAISAQGELLAFGEAEGGHASSMTEATRNIKAFFGEVGIQPLGFRKMEIVVVSNESVWVPNEVYSAACNRQYLRVVGGSGTSAIAVPCASLASTAVFSADESLVTAFKVALPGSTVVNQHCRMASCARLGGSHPVLLSHWREGYVDLAAFTNGTYIYGNTIAFSDENALRYQLVETLRTFGIDRDDTELLMCGDVDRARFAALRPFFPKTNLFTGNCRVGSAFRQLHTYRHALLLI